MEEKKILKVLSGIIDFFKRTDSDGDKSRDIYFSEEKMNSGECRDIDYAADFLGLNRIQTVLFAVAVHQSARRTDMEDLSSFMNVNYIDFLCYLDEWRTLSEKWLIRLNNDDVVSVPREVIKALSQNQTYSVPATTGLNTMQIISRIGRLLQNRGQNEITSTQMLRQIDALVNNNPETSFTQTCRKYSILGGEQYLRDNERTMFYALSFRYLTYSDDQVEWSDVDDYFDDDDFDRLRNDYYRERLRLQIRGIIDFCVDDGLVTKDAFHIVDNIKAELFADAGGLKTKKNVDVATLLDLDTLTEKPLFYDADVKQQIETLKSLMGNERFSSVCEALKSKGLRTGFTCLFYGSPGTGKTETVYQLAKLTGRKLLVADVSKLKDMFVGESEKKVKALFDNYRRYVHECDKAPILLFNEADAIFGVRMEGAERAVDKMENSIQNIILQEMETLNGIMIATTNLTSNLDKAFERRFLYKVRFDKPSVEARQKIWKSFLAELSDEQACELAKKFDFSGGQIENISRKKLVKSIIDGVEPDFNDLKAFCSQEIIDDKHPSSGRIGFC